MKNETDLEIRPVQVVMELTNSSRQKLPRGFDFQNKFLIDYEIDPVSAEQTAFVIKGNAHFPSNTVASLHKFGGKSQDVRLFDKTKA